MVLTSSLCELMENPLIYKIIYIYIYINIILHGIVCDPGFHAISNCRTEWKSLKK